VRLGKGRVTVPADATLGPMKDFATTLTTHLAKYKQEVLGVSEKGSGFETDGSIAISFRNIFTN
jgi:hypothetical protein